MDQILSSIRIFLCLILPTIITGFGLFYLDEALTTLCVLQFFYVIIPAIYIRYLSKEGELRVYFINELEGRQEQIKRGLSLFRSAFGMVLLSLIFTYYWEEEIMDYLRIPLLEHPAYIGAFMLVLIICNPFLEEWYWRLFLMKTYKESEKYRFIINLFYALFHFIILGIRNWVFNIFYVNWGSFEHIREKYGFITCLMAHYGMTLAASLALLVVYKSQLKILSCLNILKRLPPTQIQKNAAALASLIPDYAEELYQKIDKPLDIGQDEKGNQYIQSEFNRDGDSFRSHVTNQYYPQIDDAVYPSDALRKLEIKANAVFDEYRRLYYEGGLSSCYFWDKEDGGFATAWLIRKNVEKSKGIEDGSWSSINVIDIKTDGKSKWTYKITTSVVLEMNIVQNQDVGKFNITGTLTKQKEESFEAPAGNKDLELFHIMKIGTLVEDVESYLRSQLDGVYFGKTKDIVFQTRFIEGEKHFIQQRQGLAGEFKQKYG